MQKVFENIIEMLEEEKNDLTDWAEDIAFGLGIRRSIEIVKQAAEEYNNAIIDGKYCFQTCACTEKCDKCSRLCNGDTDWYENIDDWQENCNGDWIPCSERLPDECEYYLVCDELSTFIAEYADNEWRYHSEDNEKDYHIVNIIAWQPLPDPYQPKGECEG